MIIMERLSSTSRAVSVQSETLTVEADESDSIDSVMRRSIIGDLVAPSVEDDKSARDILRSVGAANFSRSLCEVLRVGDERVPKVKDADEKRALLKLRAIISKWFKEKRVQVEVFYGAYTRREAIKNWDGLKKYEDMRRYAARGGSSLAVPRAREPDNLTTKTIRCGLDINQFNLKMKNQKGLPPVCVGWLKKVRGFDLSFLDLQDSLWTENPNDLSFFSGMATQNSVNIYEGLLCLFQTSAPFLMMGRKTSYLENVAADRTRHGAGIRYALLYLGSLFEDKRRTSLPWVGSNDYVYGETSAATEVFECLRLLLSLHPNIRVSVDGSEVMAIWMYIFVVFDCQKRTSAVIGDSRRNVTIGDVMTWFPDPSVADCGVTTRGAILVSDLTLMWKETQLEVLKLGPCVGSVRVGDNFKRLKVRFEGEVERAHELEGWFSELSAHGTERMEEQGTDAMVPRALAYGLIGDGVASTMIGNECLRHEVMPTSLTIIGGMSGIAHTSIGFSSHYQAEAIVRLGDPEVAEGKVEGYGDVFSKLCDVVPEDEVVTRVYASYEGAYMANYGGNSIVIPGARFNENASVNAVKRATSIKTLSGNLGNVEPKSILLTTIAQVIDPQKRLRNKFLRRTIGSARVATLKKAYERSKDVCLQDGTNVEFEDWLEKVEWSNAFLGVNKSDSALLKSALPYTSRTTGLLLIPDPDTEYPYADGLGGWELTKIPVLSPDLMDDVLPAHVESRVPLGGFTIKLVKAFLKERGEIPELKVVRQKLFREWYQEAMRQNAVIDFLGATVVEEERDDMMDLIFDGMFVGAMSREDNEDRVYGIESKEAIIMRLALSNVFSLRIRTGTPSAVTSLVQPARRNLIAYNRRSALPAGGEPGWPIVYAMVHEVARIIMRESGNRGSKGFEKTFEDLQPLRRGKMKGRQLKSTLYNVLSDWKRRTQKSSPGDSQTLRSSKEIAFIKYGLIETSPEIVEGDSYSFGIGVDTIIHVSERGVDVGGLMDFARRMVSKQTKYEYLNPHHRGQIASCSVGYAWIFTGLVWTYGEKANTQRVTSRRIYFDFATRGSSILYRAPRELRFTGWPGLARRTSDNNFAPYGFSSP